MGNCWIPQSFIGRAYASEYFANAVSNALQTSSFYQSHIPQPETDIPLLTRELIRDNNDLLLNGYPETGRTSGSTGVPVRISWSQLKSERERLSNQLLLDWMGGLLPRVRLISQREAKGQPDALDICSAIESQIEFILDAHKNRGIRSLVSYPTNMQNLSDFIIRNKLDFSFIERVVCYSESFDESHRQAIQAAFPRAKIWSTYSCSEVGMIATLCPYGTGYHHVMAHNLGVEVLNSQRLPCQDGELGHLVLTDYFNQNMPFIRYEIGDLAIAGQCPCGKIQLPSLKSVLGKVRGSLKRLDGSPIMFANIAVTLRNLDNLKQYQVIQEALQLFTFRYVSDDARKDMLMQQVIVKELIDYLGFDIQVRFIKESFIAREASGKFHASICRV